MAHNINFNEQTGRHSFFSVQQKAWHGLGQIVEQYPTSEEAIVHAGLDYEVIKSPLFTQGRTMNIGDSGELIEANDILVPNSFATLRTDTNRPCHVLKKVYTFYINTKIRLQFKYNSKIYLQSPFFCNNFSIYNLPF